MRVDIYTIQETLFKGEAEKIIAKTLGGEISVLDNHLPIVTELKSGPLKIISKNGEEKIVNLAGGFLEVRPESHTVILARTAY